MRIIDEIRIEASPDVVWAVTEDVERWPEWTRTVTSVTRVDEGPLRLGSVTRIKQPWQPESDWVVTAFAGGRRFAWQSRRRGVRMTAKHELFAEGTGTKNLLSLEVEGLAALLLWPVLRIATRYALSSENRGLKARCEEIAAGVSR